MTGTVTAGYVTACDSMFFFLIFILVNTSPKSVLIAALD